MRQRRSFDLGYPIHTNRELGLMLRGLKPLAAFTMIVGDEPSALVRYLRLFDRHAAQGKFVREEKIDRSGVLSVRRVFYARPGEEWRIQAMSRLLNERRGWTLDGERREGFLLGYEEWETERWLDHLRQQRLL